MGGITTSSFNPGMQVRSLGEPGASPFNPTNGAFEFLRLDAQREVDKVAFQDVQLTQLAQNGSLNRDEFISLSAQQDQLARLSGQFAADGGIDDTERLRLNALRSEYQEDLANYRTRDEHPVVGHDVQDRQSAFLYDQMAAGKLRPEQAMILRMHMSAANFANGADEARGLELPGRMANSADRLARIWTELGAGGARP